MSTRILTKEEQKNLAIRAKDGDVAARNALISCHMGFLNKQAFQLSRRTTLEQQDLVSEGVLGIIRAIKSFDPDRGTPFLTYAAWWVIQFMTIAMRRDRQLYRGTSQAQELVFSSRFQKDRFNGMSDKDLANKYNVKIVNVERVAFIERSTFSLDATLRSPDDNGSERTLHDQLASDGPLPDTAADARRRERTIRSVAQASVRNAREQYVFDRRLCTTRPLSLEEIGTHWKVSRQRVKQIEKVLISRIKRSLSHRRDLLP